MSINFEPNSLLDIKILSEVEIDTEKLYYKQLKEKTGKEYANVDALDAFKKAFNQYKDDLLKTGMGYGKFLNAVEHNISVINNDELESSEVRCSIAKKLSDLANRRLEKERLTFSAPTDNMTPGKLIHIIGQVFQGHGIRTKGEWGEELAYRMLLVDVKKGLAHDEMTRASQPSEDTLKRIIELQPDQFKRFIDDAFFKEKEKGINGKFKVYLYNDLCRSPQKRDLFQEHLLSRKDWLEQAFDIVDKSYGSHLINTLVTPKMVARFQKDLEESDSYTRPKKYEYNPWYQDFSEVLVARALQDYLERAQKGQKDCYHQINRLLESNDFSWQKIKALLSPEVKQDMEKYIHLYNFNIKL